VNRSLAPFTFEAALHTYLAVGDVRESKIEGLGGRTFIDKVDHFARKQQGEVPFSLEGETDRVYLGTTDTVKVHDTVGRRVLTVAKEGSNSTVVWNPWAEKVKGMADFGNEEWPGMVCIETANAADDARTLAPGARHRLRSIISAAPAR
jgi:glucose-6-phosphate 1-epimerase